MIVFVHIPRTGGTALVRALAGITDAPTIHTNDLVYVDLRNVSSNVGLIHGHLILDNTWLKVANYKDVKTITVLRDPIDRVTSLYHRFRIDPGYPYHKELQTMSIADYVNNGQFAQTYQANNDMVRRLSGAEFGYDEMPWCAFDRALVNLEWFDVVGVYGWYRPLYNDIWKHTGLVLPPLEKVSVGDRPTTGQLDPVDLEAIQEHNQLDFALYAAACRQVARGLNNG